jgi:Dit-like phage tail protein
MAITQLPRTAVQSAQNGRGYVDNLANKFIVKPKSVKGINGFVFDYQGEANLQIKADITDHYLEDNSPAQDHIALNPIHLTLRGYIGELIMKKPQGLLGAIDSIQNRLTTVPAYLGKYTPQATSKIQSALTSVTNTVNKIDQSLARVKNVVDFFGKSVPGSTKQVQAFMQLQSLWQTRAPFSVETPYGVIDNMAIESVILVQDEVTNSYSDITVELKQIRLVNVQTSTTDFKAGRLAQQSKTATDKGSTKGAPVNKSLLLQGFNYLRGT